MFCKTYAAFVFALVVSSIHAKTAAQETSSSTDGPNQTSVQLLVQSIVETILNEHIEPPARQQLVLEVIRGLAKANGSTVPPDLASAISDANSREQIYQFLARELAKNGGNERLTHADVKKVELVLSAVLPGGLRIVSIKEALAREQIAANRYVGVGVQISQLGNAKGQQFLGVFADGPASDAGIVLGDFLESVDGTSTLDRTLEDVIQDIRGIVGTTVKLSVRTEGQPARELKLVRRIVPIKSVSLIERDAEAGACMIRVERIAASSLNEIQRLVATAEQDASETKLIVLDLRMSNVDNLHNLNVFADGILDECTIGQVQSRLGVRALKSEDGTAFGPAKIAMLFTPGRSDALDLLAIASSNSGMPVFSTAPTDSVDRLNSVDPSLSESVPVEGLEYAIEIRRCRLLQLGEVYVTPFFASKKTKQIRTLKSTWTFATPFGKKHESELGFVLHALRWQEPKE